MKIDDDMIDRIAGLAYLRFEKEQKEQIRDDLEKILSFVEKLNELDIDRVEPLVYLSGNDNSLREDFIKEPADRVDALRNAPASDNEFFLVPKVIPDSKSEE